MKIIIKTNRSNYGEVWFGRMFLWSGPSLGFNAYIKFLETEYIDLKKKCDTIVPAYNTTVNLYKTKNGWRLVLNNKKSIQFALTENISDL